MRIRRRTAVALGALVLLLSLGGVVAMALRPSYLRKTALEALQGLLAKGYEAEIGEISYDLGEGRIVAKEVRLVRTGARREVLVNIPRVDARTRLWTLVTRQAVTAVDVTDPEILVEISPEGRLLLAEALQGGAAAPGGSGAHPQVLVTGGTLRISYPSILAPGEEVRFDIKTLLWLESVHGAPSKLAATLVETGSPRRGGTGSLGAVTLGGDFPPTTKDGLRMAVERFTCDEFLRERLDPALLGRLSVVSFEGEFGEGPNAPGLEIRRREPPGGAPSWEVTVRPRNVNFLLADFPSLFTDLSGDASWRDGTLRLEDLAFRRDAAVFAIDGKVEDFGPDATGRVEFRATDLYLDSGLRNALPPSVRRVWDAYGLAGVIDVEGASIGRSAPDAPFALAVKARLRDGEMSYRGYVAADGLRYGFDYPLTGVTGTVSVDYDGSCATIDLRDVRGVHGALPVTAHGTVRDFGGGRAEVAVVIEADDFPLDDDVRRASRGMEDLWGRWAPGGRLGHLRVEVEQDPDRDRGAKEKVIFDLGGTSSFRYENLPLRLEAMTGRVHYAWVRTAAGRVLEVRLEDVQGRTADGGAIRVAGTVTGEHDPELRISLRGEGVPLDGALERAIREAGIANAISVWDRVRPSGPADFRAEIRGIDSRPREEYWIDLRGAAVQGWGEVRLPAAGLTGTVEVKREAVVLRDVRGESPEGPIAIDGTIHDPGGAAVVDLRIRAEDFPLDATLRERLGPVAARLEGYFGTVRPQPGLRGSVDVLLHGTGEALEPVVTVSDLRGGIAPLDLRNLDVAGGRATYRDDVVTVEGIEGSMADRDLLVREGRFDLAHGEGSLSVEVRRLRFPRDLLGLLSEETAAGFEKVAPDRFFHVDRLELRLSEGWRKVAFDGVLALSPVQPGVARGLGLEGIFDCRGVTFLRGPTDADPTRLTGTVGIERGVLEAGVHVAELSGTLELDGELGATHHIRARLTGASALVEERRLRDASANLALNLDGFLLTELRGKFAEGEIGGNFHSGDGQPAYQGKFTLSGARARELFTPTNPGSAIRGRVGATLELSNRTGRRKDLRGRAQLDVEEARLVETPSISRILGLFQRSDSEFTAAHFLCAIEGDRLTFEKLDLLSDTLALHQAPRASYAWLDGRLDLNLLPELKGFTDWPLIKQLKDLVSLPLAPVVSAVYAVNVSGTIQQPDVTQRGLQFLYGDAKDRPPAVPLAPPEIVPPPLPPWDF